ncbi:MAG: MBL fold metallo-hydrolase [Haloechinothrix sp.]
MHIVGSGGLGISSPYDCHVYLLSSARALALIDAGSGLDTGQIIANIVALGHDPSRIEQIFLTHAHADHAGGAHQLAAHTGAQVFASEPEVSLLRAGSDEQLGLDAARRNGTYPADYTYQHHETAAATEHGQEHRVGELTVRAIVVPGHTPGSTCYLVDCDGLRVLFSGDCVFPGGFVSVLNVPGSDAAAYRESLPALAGLGVDSLLSGHHLVRLRGGQVDLDRAIDRLRLSVIPNIAIGWLPPGGL